MYLRNNPFEQEKFVVKFHSKENKFTALSGYV